MKVYERNRKEIKIIMKVKFNTIKNPCTVDSYKKKILFTSSKTNKIKLTTTHYQPILTELLTLPDC